MPTADGRFKGLGWSQRSSDAWTRVFGPALYDDPDPEESSIEIAALLAAVPTPPSREVPPTR